MATRPPHTPSPAASGQRQEILELYVGLAGKSHAQVLGVPPSASPASVRGAFVALARRLHPDALAPGDADLRDQLHAIFIRLNDAYRGLGGHSPTTSAARHSPDPPRETAAPTVAPRSKPVVAELRRLLTRRSGALGSRRRCAPPKARSPAMRSRRR